MNVRADQDAKNIGARFRSARSLVPDLNRKMFCERHGINRYTMQSWENGLHISKGKNVWKFIEALQKEGVFCSIEWLLYGKGAPAKTVDALEKISNEGQGASPTSCHPHLNLVLELIKVSPNLCMVTIEDELMAPKYRQGDIVVGILKELDSPIDPFVLIEKSPSRFLLRRAIGFKDQLIVLTNDERLPPMVLEQDAKIYRIVAHFPYFSY